MPSQRVNRQWTLRRRPVGALTEDCFEWGEQPVAPLEDGQVLVRNLYLSFDPTQRGWMTMDTYIPKIPLGEVMRAAAVGEIVESRKARWEPGDRVLGTFGWQDYTVTDGSGLMAMRKLPAEMPPPLALSLFGITGLTAYFGTLDLGKPQPGETFVVSAAAGATGSVAGMIAKIQGARVVGVAGGPAKCAWLREEAGFDAAIDYKAEDVGERLSELCREGIDVYFDNVGGDVLDQVLARIARGARVVLCGAISRYEHEDLPPGPAHYVNLVLRRARMEGFLVIDYAARFDEAIQQLSRWHADGRVVQKIDLQKDLENAPRTLMRLFRGENFGKQLLELAAPR
jgi:NADPH-dependent curcumin reductase CurA